MSERSVNEVILDHIGFHLHPQLKQELLSLIEERLPKKLPLVLNDYAAGGEAMLDEVKSILREMFK